MASSTSEEQLKIAKEEFINAHKLKISECDSKMKTATNEISWDQWHADKHIAGCCHDEHVRLFRKNDFAISADGKVIPKKFKNFPIKCPVCDV
jgi:hypothetical protein